MSELFGIIYLQINMRYLEYVKTYFVQEIKYKKPFQKKKKGLLAKNHMCFYTKSM